MQLGRQPLSLARAFFVALAVFVLAFSAVAHAILLDSNPPLKGTVAGPDIAIRLRFNVRIDTSRSRLALVSPDASSRTLEISKDTPPDILASHASGLGAGEYRLRWQVLASDGHITRGEIPFQVARPEIHR
jgi:hypothetical protein